MQAVPCSQAVISIVAVQKSSNAMLDVKRKSNHKMQDFAPNIVPQDIPSVRTPASRCTSQRLLSLLEMYLDRVHILEVGISNSVHR